MADSRTPGIRVPAKSCVVVAGSRKAKSATVLTQMYLNTCTHAMVVFDIFDPCFKPIRVEIITLGRVMLMMCGWNLVQEQGQDTTRR